MTAPSIRQEATVDYDRPHAPHTLSELTFVPRRMVRWFDPGQLVRTGTQTLLSTVFGAFADRRELQAALGKAQAMGGYRFNEGQFWFDFVADTGDGFDSTYTIAYLLGRPDVRPGGEAGRLLPRGRLLVMGGDQVYPFASAVEYRDRLSGPYEASFPYCDDEPPDLYAIPGNHDWYDGLASFLRLFCQERWIGAWRTRQTRSYFAIDLPGRWSLWGVDIQLHSEIDKPQLDFFQAEAQRLRDSSEGQPQNIIVCTAEPCWVAAGCGHGDAWDKLEFFLREIATRHGARVPLVLTGDLHHYARYETSAKKPPWFPGHLITAGGGGAFLAPTHHLPETIDLPIGARHIGPRDTQPFKRERTFPSVSDSRLQARWAFLRLLVGNPWFAAVLGVLYAVFIWLCEAASSRILADQAQTFCRQTVTPGDGFVRLLQSCGLGDLGEISRVGVVTLVLNPTSVAFSILIVGALMFFGGSGWRGARPWIGRIVGVLHGLLHLLLSFLLLWSVSLTLEAIGVTRGVSLSPPAWLGVAVLAAAEVVVLGGLLGAALMGGYLAITNLTLGMHDNETFSSQALTGYKNFLRMCIDEESGSLTIHAIGVPAANTSWKANPVGGGAPLVVPAGADPGVQLIDEIRIQP